MSEQNKAIDLAYRSDDEGIHVNSAAGANKLLGWIRRLRKEIAQYADERDEIISETSAFYEKKIESKKSSIEFLEGKLEAYVRATGENLNLPNGRAYYRERTKWVWGDDEKLLEYSKIYELPTRISEKPDKKELKQYLKENGGGESIVEKKKIRSFYTSNPKD